MEIQRINTYDDNRFSQTVLHQHGCFLADGMPYEVEIISDYEAIIRGENPAVYTAVVEEFRFYTPHITRFYNRDGKIVKEYPRVQLLTLRLDQIQPSQFFVDEDKIAAISSFIHKPQDIIIQVLPNEERFISLDGHTRLYYAVMKGWECVRAVVESSDDWVYKFVYEAQKRGIYAPNDMILVSHAEYEEKWNRFCDDFFAGDGEKGMKVREVKDNKKQYISLLLLADEQESMVDRYLERGTMYVLEDGNVKAECVVTDEGNGILEIKNIAVEPKNQGKGYGKALIDFIVGKYADRYAILQVGTGDSPLTIPFYEKCGFARSHKVPNFFTDNYDHPIYECGVQLVDMVYLQRRL